jgi:hypothetical protein
MAGKEIPHFFLSLEEGRLRTRIENQILTPNDPERDAGVRQWRLDQVERCLAAKGARLPDTVFLNSGCTGDALLQTKCSAPWDSENADRQLIKRGMAPRRLVRR